MGENTKIGELYKPDFQEVNYHDEFARSMDRIANGLATTNYDFAKAHDLVQLKERSQTVTLNTGQAFIHGFVMANNGRLFGTTRTNPAWCIRFNNLDDLTDRTSFQWPADGAHDSADSCVFVSEVNRLYVVFNASGGVIKVAEVNPDTMATTDVISISAAGNLPVIASDGTNLYIGTPEVPSRIFKYRISDFSLQGTATITARNQLHAMVFDGDRLYATGLFPAWAARIDHTTMTVEASTGLIAGVDLLTDDLCSVGDYLWCGVEAQSTQGLFKIDKATLAVEHIRTPGSSNVIFCVFFDGQWIWVAHSSVPATLTRVDPGSGQAFTHTFPTGENEVNEIVSDGYRLFVTFWNTNPGKVKRLVPPYLGSPALPVTNYLVSSTAVSNTGSAEATRYSAQVPGAVLLRTGAMLRFSLTGRFAANGNLKRLKIHYDDFLPSTGVVFDTGLLVFNDSQWWLDLKCFSTGLNAQKWVARWMCDSTLLPTDVQHSTTARSDITSSFVSVRVKGDVAGDVTMETFEFEVAR